MTSKRIDKQQKFVIGDEIWIMENNAPKPYYVWEIFRTEYLQHESDYGHPYGHNIKIKYDYGLRNSRDNSYQSKFLMLSSLENFYTSKKALIDSL